MKINKRPIYGALGLLSIGLGLFLVRVLLESLRHYGFIGYLFLFIFVVSLVLYLRYERNVKIEEKIADEVTEKVIGEYKEKFNSNELSELKKELNQHLKNKIYDEKLSFLNKG